MVLNLVIDKIHSTILLFLHLGKQKDCNNKQSKEVN